MSSAGVFESVAFNPTVQPVTAALVALIVGGGAAVGARWGEVIVEAVHAEEELCTASDDALAGPAPRAWPSFAAHTRAVVGSLAPQAAVRVETFTA